MALRIFATLAGFALFAFGLYYITADVKPKAARDRGLFVAFGPASATTVEMELPVTDLMVREEGFGPGSPWRNAHDWSDAHLQVFDATGTKLPWQRRGAAMHAKGPVAGISDGFMVFKLVPGANYTLKYTPSVAAGLTYATDFTAATAAETSQQQLTLSKQ